jgi:hypothetical protein
MKLPLAVPGFRATGVRCGIKKRGLDLMLIASDVPAAAAGVFTRSTVVGAPVTVSRERVRRGTRARDRGQQRLLERRDGRPRARRRPRHGRGRRPRPRLPAGGGAGGLDRRDRAAAAAGADRARRAEGGGRALAPTACPPPPARS